MDLSFIDCQLLLCYRVLFVLFAALTVPADVDKTMCGSVYLLAAMDTTNQINESNEQNNLQAIPVTVACAECKFSGACL